MEYKSNANSARGIVLGLLNKFSKDAKNNKVYTPLELEHVFREALERLKDFPENKETVKLELIGWKSHDKINIYKGFNNDFILEEHRKDKQSGDVIKIIHSIPKEDVNKILFFINDWKLGESHKCYEFAELLGYHSWKDLWRERKIYFKKYYYPIKVLEKIGIIDYGGRGNITKIK